MKRTGPWFWFLVGIAALGVAVAFWQGRQLEGLRNERSSRAAPAAVSNADGAGTGVQPSPTAPAPLKPEERLELMNLRRRVTELSEVNRRLPRVVDENAALRGQSTAVSNLAANRFPPGWKRRTDAVRAGQATPEAAFETFVWAIHHRDTNVLFQVVVPEMHAHLANEWQRGGGDEFWKVADMIPGFRFKSVKPGDDGGMLLEVESVPGSQPNPVKTRVVDGTWRIAF